MTTLSIIALCKGDPKLSVMDSVLFHELLRVVRVDQPQDDGLPDFLVFSDTELDKTIPDRLYRSDDGTDPYDVLMGEVINVHRNSSTRILVRVN